MTARNPADRYISLTVAAEMLDVHPVTLRRWISQGDLPGYRVGKSVRVKLGDVEALIRPIPSAAS